MVNVASRSNHGNQNVSSASTSNYNNASSPTLNACITSCASKNLLSTALIYVLDRNGTIHEARALLDNGSQPNMISSEFCERLNLPVNRTNHSVGGVGKTTLSIPTWTVGTIKSSFNSFSVELPFFIIDDITHNVLLSTFNPNFIKIPINIQLADPNFANSRKIDILLGAGIFWHLIGSKQISTGIKQPIMRQTKLGWIIGGTLSTDTEKQKIQTAFYGLVRDINLQQQLERFWKIEEHEERHALSRKELECEESFQQSHKRDANGRFEVELPLCEDPSKLGESRTAALKLLYSMERKFSKNSYLKEEYMKFQREYVELQHMTEISKKQEDIQS